MTAPILAKCKCGHRPHGTPCELGVSIVGHSTTDGPCGCPPTCPRCLNWGWVIVRRGEGGDDKDAEDCPRGCAERLVAA